MKAAPTVLRQYDLAAMRGWRTIRLDRNKRPIVQKDKKFVPAPSLLPKAA